MKIRTVHPFPARMAPELALASLAKLTPGSLVLDPMAGSGTVLRQALALGHRAVGFDLDPLAVLMSRVWTTPVDVRRVEALLADVVDEAESVDLRRSRLPWVDEETRAFIAYWFAPAQRRALHRLAWVLALRRETTPRARRAELDVLQVGLSRIIVTKEQSASLARDTSHSRPHRVALESEYDVMAGFVRSTRQLVDRLGVQRPERAARVGPGDARALPLAPHSVDAILTSPPYLNAIDYMRGHRLSLVWLGYALGELRAIRSSAVGAERAATARLTDAVQAISLAMCDPDALAPRPRHFLQRYASDLEGVLRQAARVLRPGGRATYVVGNSCLKGIFIRNADGVARAGEVAGLTLVEARERDLPMGSRYLPMTAQGALSKRMRTESVLTFQAA